MIAEYGSLFKNAISMSMLIPQEVHAEVSSFTTRIEELKEGVRKTLRNDLDLRSSMILVDTLQHLGIGYHFEEETNGVLDRCYGIRYDEDDLFITALRFRLLRQGGYSATTDVFHKFMDNKGKFKKEPSGKDIKALLSLHEASFLGAKEEEVLSQVMEFTKQQLQKSKLVSETSVARDIGLALEFPKQRRMERLEARSFTEKYRKESDRSSNILELATLDFNMVQSLYQKEIAELESWWRDLGVTEKLNFARDRPLECILWAVGLFPEPCFSTCRIEVAKAGCHGEAKLVMSFLFACGPAPAGCTLAGLGLQAACLRAVHPWLCAMGSRLWVSHACGPNRDSNPTISILTRYSVFTYL